MSKLVVIEYSSLDGVIQAPGHSGEDPEGFAHGGWTAPYMGDHRRYMTEAVSTLGALLLGRVTYQIFAGYWPTVTDPDDAIARAFNAVPKYVASTTLARGSWAETTVLSEDVAAEVDRLRQIPGGDTFVIGSSMLAQTLQHADLVDEYRLWLHPVILGAGKRLFAHRAALSHLTLVDCRTTASGVAMLTYERAASSR
jgi:dihydrofolate reductase